MNKYGPTRGEHKLRLAISICGLVALAIGLRMQGVTGIAWLEVVGISTAFFGGSAVWSAWQLWQSR